MDIPGWTAAALSGRVDAFADRKVIQQLEELIGSSKRVVLDLSKTDFLSFQMMKYLAQLNQNLGRKGGELALLRPNHSILRQIEIFVGLKVFSVYPSLGDLQSGLHVQPRAEFHSFQASDRLLN